MTDVYDCRTHFIELATRFDEFRRLAEEKFVSIAQHMADMNRVKEETIKESVKTNAQFVTHDFYEREHKVLERRINEIKEYQDKARGAREIVTITLVVIAALIGAVTAHLIDVAFGKK